MLVYVRALTGRKMEYNVETDSTIFSLKERIQEKEGIDIQQIRLIIGGRQLQDIDNFQNIMPGTTIHCVLQLRGG
jgi:hypothetical protein